MMMHSHVYNMLVHLPRYSDICNMQIRNPVVCDVSKGRLYISN